VKRFFLPVAIALVVSGCGGDDKPDEPLPTARAPISLRSNAFAEGGTIPQRFSCDGAGDSPPLAWSAVPTGAKELTLVVEDPDADRFVHWTVLKISPRTISIPINQVPRGAVETKNSAGSRGWTGPCPPEGDSPHHYVFALYATDAPLGLGEDASPDDVRQALADHAVARGTLTGLFRRR
jgi:Raf kinase inhibitor-like YbhB/YbcL family protein